MERAFGSVPVVYLDGILVNIIPTFNSIASSLLGRLVHVQEPLEAPHTVARMAKAADLSAVEHQRVRNCLAGIKDFWQRLPAYEAPMEILVDSPVVFHAGRFRTKGERTLYQTIAWLEAHGRKNPIVWIEED